MQTDVGRCSACQPRCRRGLTLLTAAKDLEHSEAAVLAELLGPDS